MISCSPDILVDTQFVFIDGKVKKSNKLHKTKIATVRGLLKSINRPIKLTYLIKVSLTHETLGCSI